MEKIIKKGECNNCGWCLDPSALVLMANGQWLAISDVNVGDSILGFDEKIGIPRAKLRTSIVLAKTFRNIEAYRIVTNYGDVIASGDHRWITTSSSHNRRWTATRDLSVGSMLVRISSPIKKQLETNEYKYGYLGGVSVGDAMMGVWTNNNQYKKYGYRLAMNNNNMPIIERTKRFADNIGITMRSRIHRGRTLLNSIETWKRNDVNRLIELSNKYDSNLEFDRGFVAGIFDAEGSFSGGILRISNTNFVLLENICTRLSKFGFKITLQSIRYGKDRKPIRDLYISGGLSENIRFFSVFLPESTRKFCLDNILDKGNSVCINAIEQIGVKTLVDITTSTKTFIADGYLTHNCCQFMAINRLTIKKQDVTEDSRKFYTLRNGLEGEDGKIRTVAHMFMPCSAHDNVNRKCTIYENRPQICRDFPVIPDQIEGTPCSYWFEIVDENGNIIERRGGLNSPYSTPPRFKE